MSGGVDSSVATLLLHQQGYSVIGVTMNLFGTLWETSSHNKACCSATALADAREVARRIGIPHETVEFTDAFCEDVVEPFVDSYRRGETPNPCVWCNRMIKFGRMFEPAREMGADLLATGHYARIIEDGGEWGLYRGMDPDRDQSYFLCAIRPELLPKILLPLGEWKKPDVRAYAEEHGLPVAAKAQSQEVCFAGGGDYRILVGEDRPGQMVHVDGRVLGDHSGISQFTIGQRKGLGLGGGGDPLYVIRIDPASNTVYVGPKGALERRSLTAAEPNYLAPLSEGQRVAVKIRSQMRPVPAQVAAADEDSLEVIFERPVQAVTPGQYAVLYQDDRVLAGARIAG
jgi:tRNA-specific 2-thiouridylase